MESVRELDTLRVVREAAEESYEHAIQSPNPDRYFGIEKEIAEIDRWIEVEEAWFDFLSGAFPD